MKRTASPAIFYFLFVATGVGVMLLGALAPALQLHQNDAQIGSLLAAQFTGQVVGALLVGRTPYRSLQFGLFLAALSATAIGLMHTPWWPVLFVYGLGMGITMTATNIAAGMETSVQERVSRLEMLNAVWPLGAMCAPLLIRARPDPGMRLYLCVAALVMLGLVWASLRPNGVMDTKTIETNKQMSFAWNLILLCVLGLLAVGVETAVSNWSSLFGMRYFPGTRAITLAPVVFWLGMLTGRSLASRLSESVAWFPLMLMSSLVAAAAITVTSFSNSSAMLVVATFACAVCVGPLYPAVLGQCVMLPGKNLVFFAAGVGSAIVPWLLGAFSTAIASLRIAFLLPVVLALMIPVILMTQKSSYRKQR